MLVYTYRKFGKNFRSMSSKNNIFCRRTNDKDYFWC